MNSKKDFRNIKFNGIQKSPKINTDRVVHAIPNPD